jgi:hypothetical protein
MLMMLVFYGISGIESQYTLAEDEALIF